MKKTWAMQFAEDGDNFPSFYDLFHAKCLNYCPYMESKRYMQMKSFEPSAKIMALNVPFLQNFVKRK